MANKQITIAFHEANRPVVQDMVRNLERAGYTFDLLACSDQDNLQLHEQLRITSGKVVLLISDNFLRSAACMYELLPTFQDLIRTDRVKAIITDSYYTNPETGQVTTQSTSFDRVANVIQYMNHWQDQYLEVRRQKRQVSSIEETVLNEQLRVIRSISSEIGEFLRFLRNRDYTTYLEFRADHFKSFFVFTNDMAAHATFSAMPFVATADNIEENFFDEVSELNLNISDIPGINLLKPTLQESTTDSNDFEFLPNLNPTEEVNVPLAPEIKEEIVPEPPVFEFAHESTATQELELEVFTPQEEPVAPPTPSEFLTRIVNELDQNNVSEAYRQFEEGLKLYPSDSTLRYAYAKAFIKYQEDIAAAQEQLEMLLRYHPNHQDAHFLQGELSEIKENFIEASYHFRKTIDLNPAYPNAHYRLANIVLYQFEDETSQALELFEKAIELDPSNADAHYQYAVLQDEHLNQPTKAIEYYRETIELQPDHPYAAYDLAVLYQRMGMPEEARAAYELAKKINPEVQTPQNDAIFLIKSKQEETPLVVQTPATPIPAATSNELISALQEDIRRLEELIINNQTMLLATQQTMVNFLPHHAETNNLAGEVKEEQPESAEPVTTIETPKVPGKIVVITGATAGIGKATADIFAANGYRLILTGRRSERLEDLKAEYESKYQAEVLIKTFDVRDPFSIDEMMNNLEEAWQDIDILINNAGLAKGLEPIHEGKLEDWETMIDTNIKGLLYMTRAVSPYMVKRRKGHIINISSTSGKEVYPNGAVYCATKSAVEALTKGMRLDLFKHNIRVSQVAPGAVEETEFSLVRFEGDTARAEQVYENFQPLRASDVAETIYYIATRPDHVNIQDVLMLSTQQASFNLIDRSGRPEQLVATDILEEQAITIGM